jgi:hypothetical protein
MKAYDRQPMKTSAYISIPYITPLLNSHQTDANRGIDFIGVKFTAIFFYFKFPFFGNVDSLFGLSPQILSRMSGERLT